MYIVDNQRCYKYYNYYKEKCVYRLKKKFFFHLSLNVRTDIFIFAV